MQLLLDTDEACRAIIKSHFDGKISDMDARKAIAGELHRCGIARMTARERKGPSTQFVADIVEAYNDLLYRKVTQTEPVFLDLKRAESASLCGWARLLLRSARHSEVRNVMRTLTKTEGTIWLADPTPPTEDDASTAVQHEYHAAPSSRYVTEEDAISASRIQGATDQFDARRRFLRGKERKTVQVATVRSAFNLPELIRPRYAVRKVMLAQLAQHPEMAYNSAAAMRSLIESEPYVDHGDFMALWDDFSFDAIDRLVTGPKEFATVLVEAVLEDRARPSRTALRSFKASVRAMGSGLGWAKLSEELTETYIALEFETSSPFDTTRQEFQDERSAGRELAIHKSADVFARVLAFDGQRLGRTVDAIYDQLSAFMIVHTQVVVEIDETPVLVAA